MSSTQDAAPVTTPRSSRTSWEATAASSRSNTTPISRRALARTCAAFPTSKSSRAMPAHLRCRPHRCDPRQRRRDASGRAVARQPQAGRSPRLSDGALARRREIRRRQRGMGRDVAHPAFAGRPQRAISRTAGFYPCFGAIDAEADRLLGDTLASNGLTDVHSLRREPHARDESCLLHGAGYCFSRIEAT
jgi:hypothetical protein